MAKNTYRRRKVAKSDLPEKVCPVCQRAFVWRRKWARDWEQVKYCSKRCAGAAKRPDNVDT